MTEATSYYPANRPPEPDDQPFRDGDREAGFEITGNFRRFSQRDDMFCRAFWDDTVRSKESLEFFRGHGGKAKPRRGEGFQQKDFALRNAAWTVADDYADRNRPRGLREGFQDPQEPRYPPVDQKVPVDSPAEMAAEIKRIARLFGADLAGITDFDERWLYASRAEYKTFEDKPNDLPDGLTSVIVMAHGMDHGLVQSYPSALAGAAVGKGYSGEAATVAQLSQYIRNLGYQAVASMNDTALVIPLAIKAGLGEYGRNQMVITPEFGPRVRFSKIFTDLPLRHDGPRRFGVTEFCAICSRCADACPPKALPHGPPAEGGANRSAIQGVRKWTADCEKCFGYWAKMRSDCAICMRVCPFNKDFSRWQMRLARRLAGTGLRRLMLWLDIKLGYGGRRKPGQWWQSLREGT
ncbi:MAG: reductive dehalogenase [Alphaproteobacteria bacterium]|nr:reductive dehalogenase [Alphaproteobacteria bacterium]MDP6565324.1 reductive dehalogenase [Alphaproteobacteria bacterium]MDP6814160.1 reductive dehalogenase [Alphaproteobacteria bacterium]